MEKNETNAKLIAYMKRNKEHPGAKQVKKELHAPSQDPEAALKKEINDELADEARAASRRKTIRTLGKAAAVGAIAGGALHHASRKASKLQGEMLDDLGEKISKAERIRNNIIDKRDASVDEEKNKWRAQYNKKKKELNGKITDAQRDRVKAAGNAAVDAIKDRYNRKIEIVDSQIDRYKEQKARVAKNKYSAYKIKKSKGNVKDVGDSVIKQAKKAINVAKALKD